MTYDNFVRGYLVAALWSSNDESTPSGGEPLDNNYELSDFSDFSLHLAIADCEKFQKDNAELLKIVYELYDVRDGTTPQDYAGHDFWLTRNGHGCGFWDRGFGEFGEKLTVAAKTFKEKSVVVSHGKVYLE